MENGREGFVNVKAGEKHAEMGKLFCFYLFLWAKGHITFSFTYTYNLSVTARRLTMGP
jgi:hypothetical protein